MMISKAEEIFNSLHLDFPEFVEEITELSKNDQAGKNFIICDYRAINFDKVWNFSRIRNILEKSPDTILFANDIIYFIEFKDGAHKRDDVRQKVHEGILTLFQYAKSKGIISREDFMNLKIRFALICRHAQEENPFLQTLEESKDIFDLKNMEGFLVEKTIVQSGSKRIAKILNSASGGGIKKIKWVSKDQQRVCEVVI